METWVLVIFLWAGSGKLDGQVLSAKTEEQCKAQRIIAVRVVEELKAESQKPLSSHITECFRLEK